MQVELEVLDLAPDAARLAGITEEALGWGLIRLWRRCWKARSAELERAEILACFAGDPDESRLFRSLVAFGFVRELEDGRGYVRGAERRLGLLKARQKNAARMNANRWGAGRSTTDRPSIDASIDGSIDRPIDASIDASIPDPQIPKRSDLQAPDLFGEASKPPGRRPSAWQAIWLELSQARLERLAELGHPVTPEPVTPAKVNAILSKLDREIAQAAGESYAGADVDLPGIWSRFLDSEWAAGLTPPFPLQAFASPRVWRRCQTEYEARARAPRGDS